MAYYPVNIAGGTYRHKDRKLTAQRTINFWPQKQQTGGAKSDYTLEAFYGLKPFGSPSQLLFHRGSGTHKGKLYVLIDQDLFYVDKGGTYTSVGTIPGTGRAIFASLSGDLIITTDGVAYTYDESSITEGTDLDFETPYSVAVINQQALYDGDDGRFGVSGVGTPLTIDGLDYATAESAQEDVVRVYGFGDIAHMMTASRIEQWWNSGNGNPPFDKVTQGTIEIGLQARYSVAQDDEGFYFLADDNQIYYLVGGTPVPLLPSVIVREITAMDVRDDAIGWTMQLDGQWFYVINFLSGDRTFCYPKGGEWFELSSGYEGGKYSGDGYAFVYGRHIIIDRNGRTFVLDGDTYQEDGQDIRRVRTLSPLHSGLLGEPGKDIEISEFRLTGATGVGVGTSGQDSDPQVMLQWSSDGMNWSTEQRGYLGESGEEMELIFDVNEAHKIFIFRIVQTDATYASWHSAAIEAELTI